MPAVAIGGARRGAALASLDPSSSNSRAGEAASANPSMGGPEGCLGRRGAVVRGGHGTPRARRGIGQDGRRGILGRARIAGAGQVPKMALSIDGARALTQ
jgi:hypothetical protein